MRSSPLVLLAAALLGTAVALVDAVRRGDSDTTLVTTAVLALLLALGAALLRTRHTVPLRPDLAAWLGRQAAATGEPVERLADRCVAAYRAGLTGEPAPEAADRTGSR